MLRVCERLKLSEQEFFELCYEKQLRLLAYAQVRDMEESAFGRGM
ncbi:hypothetical protein [Planctomicrobium piriforme]|nr:hypothetical protein [Planctomicrobium piriforme]